MHTTISAKILAGTPGWPREREVLPACNRNPVKSGGPWTSSIGGNVAREASSVIPVIREDSDSVGNDSGRRVPSQIRAPGPSGVRRLGVVVALDVHRVFRCHRESARAR